MEGSNEPKSPGATIMWFGKHKGVRFDELDEDYVHWVMNRDFGNTVQPDNFQRFKRIYDEHRNWMIEKRELPNPLSTVIWFGRNKGAELRDVYFPRNRFEELPPMQWAHRLHQLDIECQEWLENHTQNGDVVDEDEVDEESGANLMWFGKHIGTRLDELESHYIQSMNLRYEKDWFDPNMIKWMKAFKAYEKYLDSIRRRAISPGSILLWFGDYKGHEIRKVYNPSARGGGRRWTWYMKNIVWAPLLRQIEQDYLEWLDTHRRVSGSHKEVGVILNPVGEALGPWDDGVASEDESSDDMGSFIAISDEGEISDCGADEFDSGTEHDTGIAEGSPDSQRGSHGDTDQEGSSSSSFPDAHDLINRAMARSRLVTLTSHRNLAGPKQDRPISLDQEDDSDDMPLVPMSTSQRSPKQQASTGLVPHNPASLDCEEDSDDEPLKPSSTSRKDRSLKQVASVSNDNHLWPDYGTDSDDEPLLPSNASRRKACKRRSQRNAKRPYPADQTNDIENSTSHTLISKRRRLTPDTETRKKGHHVGLHTKSAGYEESGSATRTPNTKSRSSGKHQEVLGWLHKENHKNSEDSSDANYSHFPTTPSKRARAKASPYIIH